MPQHTPYTAAKLIALNWFPTKINLARKADDNATRDALSVYDEFMSLLHEKAVENTEILELIGDPQSNSPAILSVQVFNCTDDLTDIDFPVVPVALGIFPDRLNVARVSAKELVA